MIWELNLNYDNNKTIYVQEMAKGTGRLLFEVEQLRYKLIKKKTKKTKTISSAIFCQSQSCVQFLLCPILETKAYNRTPPQQYAGAVR